MAPKVISLDLYSRAAGGYMSAQARDFATAAGAHRDVSGQWMGRAANLPDSNAGAAVNAAAGQAQRLAVGHQGESRALEATADYHRQASQLGNEMNAGLDRIDRRAQRQLAESPPSWHGTIRALANAMAQALNDLYSMRLWDLQESAGSVIEPIHQGINGLSRPPAGAAPSPVGKGSPPVSASRGPLQAASMPAQAVPDTASAAAPAAASQPDRPELVPVMVGLPVGGGAPTDAQPPAIKPDDSDDDDLGGGDPPDDGGTIVSMPAGGGAGGRAGSEKPRDSRGLGKSAESADLAKTAPAAPSVASPVESATPLAAAPAAADRRQRRRPQNGKSPMKGQQ